MLRAPKEVGGTVGKSSVTLENTRCHELNVDRNRDANGISGENQEIMNVFLDPGSVK